jgi:predicted ATP-binding protein involved in virulence
MRIDSLKIENFRCYESAEFNFNHHFNLVIGVNGIGKSSLLSAIAQSLVDVTSAALRLSHFVPDDDIRFILDKVDGKVRFEKRYPLTLTATGEAFGVKEWKIEKLRSNSGIPSDSQLNQCINKTLSNLDSGDRINLPVLAFYRANRRWTPGDVSAISAATERPSRMEAYKNWWDAAASVESLERWVISKTLERLQRLAESGQPQVSMLDELDLVNSAIKQALPESIGLRYDMTLRSLMVDIRSGQPLPFNSLSDGQRALTALIADIARRMCLLNPHFGDDVLSLTDGIIIIDELDIHLHPAWQRSLVTSLKTAFPKVQFIAASHSPQIIGSLQPEEVIILDDGESSHPRVTYGLDSSSILSEVMDVEKRAPEIQALLTELFTSIESNELEAAKAKLSALKLKAPDLPEFAGAEALIRRKEILGK